MIQESLDRKRVIPLMPELVLDADQIASLVELRGAWSPDGRFIVLWRPGLDPALLVVLPEQGRVLKTIERASHPGLVARRRRLAFLRLGRDPSSGWTLQVIARDFGGGRSLLELAEPCDQPVWSPDGQSILMGGRRSRLQPRDIELMRVFLDSGLASPRVPLGSSETGRGRDTGFRSASTASRSNASSRPMTMARYRLSPSPAFPASKGSSGSIPLDISMHMGSLAFDPEGQLVAVRVETAGHLAPPLLCNPVTETVTLLAPDAVIRREWLGSLVATARELLQTALPPPVLDGSPVTRQGMLPLPGEIPDQSPVICSAPSPWQGSAGRSSTSRQAMQAARPAMSPRPSRSTSSASASIISAGTTPRPLADLDLLESRPNLREGRLLPLRAQILQAQGESGRARDITDYLLKSRGEKRLVEDTPAGPVFSPAEDPARLWQRYLAQRLASAPRCPPPHQASHAPRTTRSSSWCPTCSRG